MELAGAYTADRAAALSGVPRSTIHYWANHEILVPSVSAERVKLWSFADLLALRVIYWLRQPKVAADEREIPRTTMTGIRRALRKLGALELELFERGRPTIGVSRGGEVVIMPPGRPPELTSGQLLNQGLIDIIAPFETRKGVRGPDLNTPRPLLRIVPGKLAGSPHVVDTRVETRVLAALAARGFSTDKIRRLYPSLERAAIEQAIDLENALAENLAHQAAA